MGMVVHGPISDQRLKAPLVHAFACGLALCLAFSLQEPCVADTATDGNVRIHWVASNWASFHGLTRQCSERVALNPDVKSSTHTHSRIWPLHGITKPDEVKIQYYTKQTGIHHFVEFDRELRKAEFDVLAVAVQLKMVAKESLAADYEQLLVEMKTLAERQKAELILVTYANTLDGEDRRVGRDRLLQLASKFNVKVCPWWDVMRRMRERCPQVSSFDEKVGGHPSRAITYPLSYAFYFALTGDSPQEAPVSLRIGDWSAEDEPLAISADDAELQREIAWEAVQAARYAIDDPTASRYQSRDGHPADHLPPYIKQVSGFGERPEWSHDGKRILFVDKPMGEVYELDLESGLIHPKTRHFHHYGFTRANYLANGDLLLSGPGQSFDVADREARKQARHQCWLSVLPSQGDSEPIPLETLAAEGPAVSRKQMRVAWTHRDKQDPSLGRNHARHFVADLVYRNGRPALANQKVVFDSHQLPFQLGNASLETQDFAGEDDRFLIFSVYQINDGNNTDTFIVDTITGEFRNLTRSPHYYDEPEGVFPDGRHVCVEHAPCAHSAWPLSDLYRLKLDGSGEMQRLTYFSEFRGFKATQGVVSDDGSKLCFQIGKSGDEAGVGYGFFIMDLRAAVESLEPFRSFASEEPSPREDRE